MGRSLAHALDAGTPVLWIDFYDYAARLFPGGGVVPWFDDAAFAAFHGKAQSLLDSDVISLPVGRVAEALLQARPALVEAMGAKSRPAYPLRRLLEDDALRDAVAGLLAPLRAADGERPLALVLPSPRCWLAAAYASAHGRPLAPEVADDADEIDGAAVYVADFLRAFAGAGVDLVLLCEDDAGGPASAEALALYDPVVKTARHYRWAVGLLDVGGRLPAGAGQDLDVVIAPTPDGARGGAVLPEAFWQHGDAPQALGARLVYASIPAGTVPEIVLERLAGLRAGQNPEA